MNKIIYLTIVISILSACTSEPTSRSVQQVSPKPALTIQPSAKASVKPTPKSLSKPLTSQQKAEAFRLQFYKEVDRLGGQGIKSKYARVTMQNWEEQEQGVELGLKDTCQEMQDFPNADAAAQSAYEANQQSIPLEQLQVWYGAKFAAAKPFCGN